MRVLLCVLALTAPAVVHAETCPERAIVKLDPVSWAKRVRTAESVGALNPVLIAAHLAPVADEPDGRRVSVSAANAFKARLDVAGREVRVLNVLATVLDESMGEDGVAADIQRGAVLVAIEPGTWCLIETPFLEADGSAYGSRLCDPTVFGFEPLIAKKRDALRVVESHPWCGTAGNDRGGSSSESWWEVRGFALVGLLRIESESAYHSASAIGNGTSRSVTWSGGYPRVATVVVAESCMGQRGEDDLDDWTREIAARNPCRDAHTVETWKYREGGYVRVSAKAAK